MAELQEHADANKLSVAQVVMANEVAVSGKSEAEINAFIDKIHTAMVNIVKAGLKAPESTLPGPIKLKTKAGDVYKRAMDDKYEAQRGVGVVSAYALAGSEENARGHLVVTAPTGGSAGVLPALVYALGEGGRKLPQEKIRDGFLAAAAVGYLCKHNATLSGAEGGCQAEIGVASAMGAAFIAQAHDFSHQVVANAAESSLQHHLGMTCDPVAGFVQMPCIERCAFGAVKAWTGFMIASNEIPANRRVDFDTTGRRHGAHREGDEREVQGDVGGRPGGLRGALLSDVRERRESGYVARAPGRRSVAWLITAVYYFYQYTLRSAPAVMMPQLSDGVRPQRDGRGVDGRALLLRLLAVQPGRRRGDGSARAAPRRADRRGDRSASARCSSRRATAQLASVGRLLQGAGGVFALVGAAYIATTNFPASRAATLIGATQMFGMAGGSAGQFVVGPLIASGVSWTAFWAGMGIAGLAISAMLVVLLPGVEDRRRAARRLAARSGAARSRVVFRNPQSILCGMIAGLLFIPTTIFDMVWGVRYLQDARGLDYARRGDAIGDRSARLDHRLSAARASSPIGSAGASR